MLQLTVMNMHTILMTHKIHRLLYNPEHHFLSSYKNDFNTVIFLFCGNSQGKNSIMIMSVIQWMNKIHISISKLKLTVDKRMDDIVLAIEAEHKEQRV